MKMGNYENKKMLADELGHASVVIEVCEMSS